MRDVVNAEAIELIEDTVAAGASAAGAKKWWLGELARRSNDSGVPLDGLGMDAAGVARIEELIAQGSLNDKMARQVIDGILAGEGTADEVVAARGLVLVSDDGALNVAVDEAIAANPGVADKVRDGKVAAVGALVGAVMKATRGQADAGRVKELLLERLGAQE
jgi:aspartyl-tRNA(Asn)/glutamyl-tRNA(Gln) amidotransferase subunit B